MKHSGTQRLETERLVLRRFTQQDAAAMYKNWAADGEVTKYLTWPTHPNPEVTEQVVADWVRGYDSQSCYQWAIVLKELGEPIGSITVVSMDEGVAMAEVGYCIGRPWWNKGITSEALKAVMEFLFAVVGFHRIQGRHDPRNPYSGHVMQKCGMEYEGTLRSADRNNQGICDICCYARLNSDG